MTNNMIKFIDSLKFDHILFQQGPGNRRNCMTQAKARKAVTG